MKYLLLIIISGFLTPTLSFGQSSSLFNGKNLDGWHIYGTEKWYVEEGLLICESGDDKEYGYIGTVKNYKDFI